MSRPESDTIIKIVITHQKDTVHFKSWRTPEIYRQFPALFSCPNVIVNENNILKYLCYTFINLLSFLDLQYRS